MAQESAQGLEQQLDSVHLDEGEDAEWEDVSQLDDETLSSMAAICQKYNVPELVISVTETLRFIVGDEMVEEDTVVHATGVVPQATSDALEACVSELKSVTPELLSSAVAGPAPGDPVPSIAVTPLGSASTQPLDEFCRASVVLIDFWCSEFPESMAALSQYDGVLAEQPWGENFGILAINLDAKRTVATKVVKQIPCKSAVHAWCSPQSMEALCIASLPHWILVKNNQIVWRGHPTAIEFEETINSLLANGPIIPASNLVGRVGAIEGVPSIESLSSDELFELSNQIEAYVSQAPIQLTMTNLVLEKSAEIKSTGLTRTSRLILAGTPGSQAEAKYLTKLRDWLLSKVAGNVFVDIE
eukprot:m.87414 g.87414  ORF g.87414 m.87414 type:complete len:358 (+) comp12829_c0_seq1:41-1114(+)